MTTVPIDDRSHYKYPGLPDSFPTGLAEWSVCFIAASRIGCPLALDPSLGEMTRQRELGCRHCSQQTRDVQKSSEIT